ncbi:PZF1 [Candida pseudojiufengensis]|uniref:PZF1 n=1 Tax=Candida pseudojiufengensis TaxID=497109 RepID=UPI00222521F2|nr:PZF1 [Candida pseudojiufengensis]KAI5959007.1 PZF1 [Candida pseudojiufengensis]
MNEQEEDTKSVNSQASNLSKASVATVASTTSKASSSSSSRPKRYLCTYENCDKAYNRPSLLDQHLRSHTGDRPFPCSYPECTKSFLRKHHLDAHLISHSRDKPYHCSVCGKGVNTPQHLKRHEIVHTKSFKCTYENCNESFYKHQSLTHHIQSVHEKTLTCSICGKTFARPWKFANHKLKYHGESPAYQCDSSGCFKNFKTWSALQFHLKQEHPKLKCDICGKGCVGKQGLKSHMLTHDDAIKIWKCNYCDLGKFNEKDKLIDHYNKFHDGNIPEELLKNNKVDLDGKISSIITEEGLKESTSGAVSANKPSINTIKSLGTILSTEEESSDTFFNQDVRSDTAQALKSTNSISSTNTTSMNNSTKSKSSSKNQQQQQQQEIKQEKLIDTISKSVAKQIHCPKLRCNRFFYRLCDLHRHLRWHDENLKRIENFLDGLQQQEEEEEIEGTKKRKILEERNDDAINKKVKVGVNEINDNEDDDDDGNEDDDDDDHEYDEYNDEDAAFDEILSKELSSNLEAED